MKIDILIIGSLIISIFMASRPSIIKPTTSLKSLAAGLEAGIQESAAGSGLELFRINVSTESRTVIKAMKEAGFGITLHDLEFYLDKVSARLLNKLSVEALAAAKSKVPVHYYDGNISAVLRNKHIKLSTPKFRNASKSSVSRDVFVDTEPHVVPYRKSILFAHALASLKDQLEDARSGPSIIEKGYRPEDGLSLDWIGKAQKAFIANKGKVVAAALGGKI